MKQFLITVAGVLVGLVLFLVIAPFAIVGMISSSLHAAPPTPSSVVLSLDLRPDMTDQRNASGFGFGGKPALLDVLARLDAASSDDKVKGIYVRASTAGMPAAQAEELRTTFAHFRQSGKFIIAHIQNDGVRMSMPGYVAVAGSDEVWLQKSSEFQPMGLSSEVTFFGDSLRRYHAQAQFVTREEYKTAPSTLTDNGLTAANREETMGLMTGLYASMVADIAADRKITPKATSDAIEATPFTAERAIELHLIDKMGRPEEAERAALDRAHLDDSALLDFDDYHPTLHHGGPVIAVVQGEGAIVSGPESHELFNDDANMNSDVTARALLDAANDNDVKAIVFRVSSPGGSVVASDQILAALRTAKSKGKRVVVSMGEVAASGGYYVSTEADEIIAEPTTITGSIGVFAGKLVIGSAMDYYLSSNTERLSVGSPYTSMFSANTPFSPQERAMLESFIDSTYREFIGLVANGRHMSVDQAHALAHGRVWTGQQALERHLVDRLGGFDVAVARAKALANIDANTKVELRYFPQAKNPFSALSRFFGASADDAQAMARFSAFVSDPRVQQAMAAMREEDANVRARAPDLHVR